MNNIKKEIITIVLSGVAALAVALLFDSWGGYAITITWTWELFILLMAQVFATRRIFFDKSSLACGLIVDVGVLSALMIGYLINFESIETKTVHNEMLLDWKRDRNCDDNSWDIYGV